MHVRMCAIKIGCHDAQHRWGLHLRAWGIVHRTAHTQACGGRTAAER